MEEFKSKALRSRFLRSLRKKLKGLVNKKNVDFCLKKLFFLSLLLPGFDKILCLFYIKKKILFKNLIFWVIVALGVSPDFMPFL